jgi:hypothetical protein
MGYLYYDDLGNVSKSASLANVGPFKNLVSSIYWSGTASAANPGSAWVFGMANGAEVTNVETAAFYGLYVHPGDVADPTPTPIPATAYLFGTGLLGLVALHQRFRRLPNDLVG